MTALVLDFPPPSAPEAVGETPGVDVVQVLGGRALRLNAGSDNVICVIEGTLYVEFDDDEFVLMAGDQLTVRTGEPHHAWNPASEIASVVIGEVQAMTGYRSRLGPIAARGRGQAA